MTFSTIYFDPLTPLAPNSQILPHKCCFLLEMHCCRRHTCTCAKTFLHHLGTGCCLPKTTFKTKIGGGLGQGKIPKIWDPYLFPLAYPCFEIWGVLSGGTAGGHPSRTTYLVPHNAGVQQWRRRGLQPVSSLSLSFLLSLPFSRPIPYPVPSVSPPFPHPFPSPSLPRSGPLNPARGSGERCKLPQRGLQRSPSRNRIRCILALKSDIWWQQF